MRRFVIGASLSEPHIDELNVRNLYIIIIMYILLLWYACHLQAAIEIVKECAVYSNSTYRPHENICLFFYHWLSLEAMHTREALAWTRKSLAVSNSDNPIQHCLARTIVLWYV